MNPLLHLESRPLGASSPHLNTERYETPIEHKVAGVVNPKLATHGSILNSRPTIKRLAHSVATVPQAALSQQSFWAKKSLLTATIAATSFAAIGLATYYGYRHFTPKPPQPETVGLLSRPPMMLLGVSICTPVFTEAARLYRSYKTPQIPAPSTLRTQTEPIEGFQPAEHTSMQHRRITINELYTIRILKGICHYSWVALSTIARKCGSIVTEASRYAKTNPQHQRTSPGLESQGSNRGLSRYLANALAFVSTISRSALTAFNRLLSPKETTPTDE